jgi:hypothetical protein
VSRLYPERVLVRFSPTEIELGQMRVGCDPGYGAEPWQGAVAALSACSFPSKCAVTVVLSNRLVRYALVPWSDALATPAEKEAYLRHHFAKIHGERAKAWTLRSSEGPPRAPRLASAVDAALVEAIKSAFAARGRVRLASIQPQLMHEVNAARRRLPANGAWLVMAEPERACVALLAEGAWRAVQNAKGEWRALLERERLRVDVQVAEVVVLSGGAPT